MQDIYSVMYNEGKDQVNPVDSQRLYPKSAQAIEEKLGTKLQTNKVKEGKRFSDIEAGESEVVDLKSNQAQFDAQAYFNIIAGFLEKPGKAVMLCVDFVDKDGAYASGHAVACRPISPRALERRPEPGPFRPL